MLVFLFFPFFFFFFFNDTATTEIYTLSLHDALPISWSVSGFFGSPSATIFWIWRSEEHTSELQSRRDLVCRLLLEKKKNKIHKTSTSNQTTATDETRFNNTT